MNIAFIEPFSRAWKKMVQALFKPFDLTKWFVIGFTAFLAELTDGFHRGSSIGNRSRDWDIGKIFEFPSMAMEWLRAHPFWSALIVFFVLLVILIILLLNWLSSRGKFMFLHNVVRNCSEVKGPWYDYREQGNALFLWRLGYGIILAMVFIGYLTFCFLTLSGFYFNGLTWISYLLPIMGMGLLFLAMLIITAYISLFLNDFIVPLMYKHKIRTNQAWGLFLSIFKEKMGYFLLYGLIVMVLKVAIFFLVAAAGLATCCIGFILLIIPYIGTVVTLPIPYTLRAFSVEFLAQFGEKYSLFTSLAEEDFADST
ncbi:hypothetical protein JW877_03260 [bacterium]|nr:hypothetical protein [bacterium]